ncbi:hypothetical protein F5Y19DRAFT_393188 [Xylariaceae sp. FL1651]|nr:hypothetical protein F5Y19DRAFT_393188 [Xylariaceae sp. FL1651]
MKTLQILAIAFVASIVPSTYAASDPVNNHDYEASDPVNNNNPQVPQSPPGPVQPGAPVDSCYGWIKATPGLTCYGLATSLGIDVAKLEAINPQLKGDCERNFWADYYYCTGKGQPRQKITTPPPLRKTIDADCQKGLLDGCQSAVFAASETPGPMIDWCNRYLGGPKCTETRPEGIFSSYDKFPKQAIASSSCAYPGAPPMAPRFSTACRCFTEMHPRPT